LEIELFGMKKKNSPPLRLLGGGDSDDEEKREASSTKKLRKLNEKESAWIRNKTDKLYGPNLGTRAYVLLDELTVTLMDPNQSRQSNEKYTVIGANIVKEILMRMERQLLNVTKNLKELKTTHAVLVKNHEALKENRNTSEESKKTEDKEIQVSIHLERKEVGTQVRTEPIEIPMEVEAEKGQVPNINKKLDKIISRIVKLEEK